MSSKDESGGTEAISRDVLHRLDQLEQELRLLRDEFSPSDSQAKELISQAIETLKAKGKSTVDVIDIYEMTHLPLQRIAEIMEIFQSEGRVVEYGKDSKN